MDRQAPDRCSQRFSNGKVSVQTCSGVRMNQFTALRQVRVCAHAIHTRMARTHVPRKRTRARARTHARTHRVIISSVHSKTAPNMRGTSGVMMFWSLLTIPAKSDRTCFCFKYSRVTGPAFRSSRVCLPGTDAH